MKTTKVNDLWSTLRECERVCMFLRTFHLICINWRDFLWLLCYACMKKIQLNEWGGEKTRQSFRRRNLSLFEVIKFTLWPKWYFWPRIVVYTIDLIAIYHSPVWTPHRAHKFYLLNGAYEMNPSAITQKRCESHAAISNGTWKIQRVQLVNWK